MKVHFLSGFVDLKLHILLSVASKMALFMTINLFRRKVLKINKRKWENVKPATAYLNK